MRAGYALDGEGGCIADARHHAVVFLDQAHADHHLPVPARARDLTQLVVSELVTTSNPASTSASAAALPMPDDAPVTSATGRFVVMLGPGLLSD